MDVHFIVGKMRPKILLLLVVLVLAACVAEPSEKLKVGIITPSTGPQAYYGEEMQKAYDIALGEVKFIEVVFEDSRGETKDAVTAFKKLVEVDNVDVVVGPVMSSNTMAVASLANEHKVVIISPTSSASKITDAGDYVFRVRETGKNHGIAIAEFARKNKWGKAALLTVNAENGLSYADAFKERFQKLGGKIVADELYEKDEQDIRTQILKIKAANPDVIYISGFAKGMGRAVQQMRLLGLSSQILSTVGVEDKNFLEVAGKAGEGVIYTTPFDPDSKQAAEFQKEFAERYGERTDSFLTVNAYDALKIVDQIAGVCDNAACIKEKLYATKNYKGVSGTFSFDENGDVDREIHFKVIRDGKFVIIG